MTTEEFLQRNRELAHAIQTGVAYVMEKDPRATQPKHLRVGVNMAMCEHTGLCRALFAAGVITEAQYFDAVIATLEEEKARFEAEVSALYGAHIELG